MADPKDLEVIPTTVVPVAAVPASTPASTPAIVTPMTSTRKKLKKRSKVWDEFLTIDPKDSIDGKERALCIHCKVASFCCDSHYGTKNLNDHLKVCIAYRDSLITNGVAQIFNQTFFRELVARAIIKHGYAFSWVEHEGVRKIHAYLNNHVKCITRNTAKFDCLKLHKRLKSQLKDTLQNVPGRISFTSDMWTSCQTEGYLCLTAHYVDSDWKLRSKVLNFCHVESPHTGRAMYSVVSNLLQDWGIEHKIFSMTLDNASSNDKMQKYLKASLAEHDLLVYGGSFFHVRCAAHILNLIVKDGLKTIDRIVDKIRKSVKYVKWSEVRKQTFKECVNLARIKETKALWLDVATRWNSTYMMFDRALLYRGAFKELANKDPLYLHLPGPEEWDKVEKIRDYLEPFCDITELFSGSDYPTANVYFENVCKIEMLIREYEQSNDVDLSSMAAIMLLKFEKYWCTVEEDDGDYRLLFAIAAILDPRYKKQCVKFLYERLFGDEKRARDMVNTLVSKLGSLLEEYVPSTSNPSSTSNYTSMVSTRTAKSSNKRKFDIFADFDNPELHNSCTKSKLTEYLEDPRLDLHTPLNVLDFWRENEKKYGELSHLARDVLSVPLTTVASESTFSIGGRILNKWRSSYLPENVEALITSRSWLYGYEANEEEVFTGSEVNWNKG